MKVRVYVPGQGVVRRQAGETPLKMRHALELEFRESSNAEIPVAAIVSYRRPVVYRWDGVRFWRAVHGAGKEDIVTAGTLADHMAGERARKWKGNPFRDGHRKMTPSLPTPAEAGEVVDDGAAAAAECARGVLDGLVLIDGVLHEAVGAPCWLVGVTHVGVEVDDSGRGWGWAQQFVGSASLFEGDPGARSGWNTAIVRLDRTDDADRLLAVATNDEGASYCPDVEVLIPGAFPGRHVRGLALDGPPRLRGLPAFPDEVVAAWADVCRASGGEHPPLDAVAKLDAAFVSTLAESPDPVLGSHLREMIVFPLAVARLFPDAYGVTDAGGYESPRDEAEPVDLIGDETASASVGVGLAAFPADVPAARKGREELVVDRLRRAVSGLADARDAGDVDLVWVLEREVALFQALLPEAMDARHRSGL